MHCRRLTRLTNAFSKKYANFCAAVSLNFAYYNFCKQVAIQQLHKCGAVHRETVPVHEQFQGTTVWQGEVEVFDLNGHSKASRCFAWSHPEGPNDQGERFVTVLAIHPVNSARTAVQASILARLI